MWLNEYSWKDNPFSIKPSPDTLVGIDKKRDELIDLINGGNIILLTGQPGIGKTSLLKWIELNLQKHEVFYLDAEEINDSFSIDNFLKKNTKSLFRKYPKNAVILLDESQCSNLKLNDAMKLHWDQNHIKSIVIAQTTEALDETFSEGFVDRIGHRIIKLTGLNKSKVYELIQMRTNEENPFNKEAIELIAKISDYNPRKILENCEKVCMMSNGKRDINAFDVEQFLDSRISVYRKDRIETLREELSRPLSISKSEVRGKPIKTKKVQEKPTVIPKEEQKTLVPKSLSLKLSPMQENIVSLLNKENKTTQELASLLVTSEGSVGKQLSKLAKMKIIKIVDNNRPKKYGLI